MRGLSWNVRFTLAKRALFGSVDKIYSACLAFVMTTEMAIDEVKSKKSKKTHRKVRSDKGVKRGRVRKSGKESIRSKRIKGGKNASV